MNGRLRSLLAEVYGPERARELSPRVEDLVAAWGNPCRAPRPWVDERDVILITYGDSIVEPDRPPLATLREVAGRRLGGAIGSIHLLPMYPYTSDDGFSVVDPRGIRPEIGDWGAVERLAEAFDLMFDTVVNHLSVSSEAFRRYLDGDPAYDDYFIEREEGRDYSAVVRPRAVPLFTEFEGRQGKKLVWTTFSPDQADLNYRNPKVLLDILDLLCFYASRGARYIRLDAVGFIWKEPGTSCLNLPQTHAIVKLFRAVLDLVAPGVILVTETNVPLAENLAYFGDGRDEAGLVYQFSLPPLVLHSFVRVDAETLLDWMESLGNSAPSPSASYLNFLSSHDGIGLRPVEGILSIKEMEGLVAACVERGGLVGYRHADGREVPYELNINYMDALSPPEATDSERAARNAAAHGILLSAMGVPAIYVHALLGSRNWDEGVRSSGIKRRINRERIGRSRLESELDEPGGLRGAVFGSIMRLVEARRRIPAFAPDAAQRVIRLDRRLVALERESADGRSRVLAIANVSGEEVQADAGFGGIDALTGAALGPRIAVPPFGVVWLVAGSSGRGGAGEEG